MVPFSQPAQRQTELVSFHAFCAPRMAGNCSCSIADQVPNHIGEIFYMGLATIIAITNQHQSKTVASFIFYEHIPCWQWTDRCAAVLWPFMPLSYVQHGRPWQGVFFLREAAVLYTDITLRGCSSSSSLLLWQSVGLEHYSPFAVAICRLVLYH